jgi:hypothetical protein
MCQKEVTTTNVSWAWVGHMKLGCRIDSCLVRRMPQTQNLMYQFVAWCIDLSSSVISPTPAYGGYLHCRLSLSCVVTQSSKSCYPALHDPSEKHKNVKSRFTITIIVSICDL